MLEQIARVMNPLPPVRGSKNPWLPFVLGTTWKHLTGHPSSQVQPQAATYLKSQKAG
jgi:hypothetical protein